MGDSILLPLHFAPTTTPTPRLVNPTPIAIRSLEPVSDSGLQLGPSASLPPGWGAGPRSGQSVRNPTQQLACSAVGGTGVGRGQVRSEILLKL